MRELAHFVSLLPLLEADLQRPWQTCLVATDAAVDYGFGVSVADVPEQVVRELGRVAAAHVHLVRLGRRHAHPDDEAKRPRKGIVHDVGLSKWDFRTVISSRRQFDAHSGGLEAHGVALGLRWLLRSVACHGRRTSFLIDAQSVLGAIRKGRSSAPLLKHEIRFIGIWSWQETCCCVVFTFLWNTTQQTRPHGESYASTLLRRSGPLRERRLHWIGMYVFTSPFLIKLRNSPRITRSVLRCCA